MGLPSDASPSLEELSRFFKVPVSILREVEKRGRGAYANNIESVRLLSGKKDASAPRSQKMSINQWSRARLYSFLNKGTTYKTTDSDLAKKANY